LKYDVLEPTEDNIKNTIDSDSIGRNEALSKFVTLIASIDRNFSIAVNAPWGEGKTFFVKQAKMLIDGKCENVNRRDIENGNYISVYYDAWKNDNDVDPILSLIYEIKDELKISGKLSTGLDLENFFLSLVNLLTGHNVGEVKSAITGEDCLKILESQKAIEAKLHEFFEDVTKERANRFVIFIDELDRCKPSFAIKFLERIKHYFRHENITFVFSVNLEQLQYTVKAYYGEGFNGLEYLDRFFDFVIKLPEIDNSKFKRFYQCDEYNNYLGTACDYIFDTYKLSMRKRLRYYNLIRATAYNKALNGGYGSPEGNANIFVACYIVPVLLALESYDSDKYKECVSGNDITPFELFKNSSVYGSGFSRLILKGDEHYVGSIINGNEENITYIEPMEKFTEVYEYLFKEPDINHQELDIGHCRFNKSTKQYIDLLMSGLSHEAEYV